MARPAPPPCARCVSTARSPSQPPASPRRCSLRARHLRQRLQRLQRCRAPAARALARKIAPFCTRANGWAPVPPGRPRPRLRPPPPSAARPRVALQHQRNRRPVARPPDVVLRAGTGGQQRPPRRLPRRQPAARPSARPGRRLHSLRRHGAQSPRPAWANRPRGGPPRVQYPAIRRNAARPPARRRLGPHPCSGRYRPCPAAPRRAIPAPRLGKPPARRPAQRAISCH